MALEKHLWNWMENAVKSFKTGLKSQLQAIWLTFLTFTEKSEIWIYHFNRRALNPIHDFEISLFSYSSSRSFQNYSMKISQRTERTNARMSWCSPQKRTHWFSTAANVCNSNIMSHHHGSSNSKPFLHDLERKNTQHTINQHKQFCNRLLIYQSCPQSFPQAFILGKETRKYSYWNGNNIS